MAGNTRDLRRLLRLLHLITGIALATYAYLPPGTAPWLRWLLMVVAVPAITATGVWMWKQGPIRRFVTRVGRRLRAGARPAHPVRHGGTGQHPSVDVPQSLVAD